MNILLRRVWLAIVVIAILAGWSQWAWTAEADGRSAAWVPSPSESGTEIWTALTPLDRQILELLSESQLQELFDGADPGEIYLSTGETLADLARQARAATARGLLYAPVEPCRLFDTRQAPEGRLQAGETRGFRVREATVGYAQQGGAVDGCGLPGLAGVTLKSHQVRVVALNVITLDAERPGSLAIWPANRSEPEVGSISLAAALSGSGQTAGLLVPICDEAALDPCGGGDLKIRARMSGAHVVADVVGYFYAAEPGLSAGVESVAGREEPEAGPTVADRDPEPKTWLDRAVGWLQAVGPALREDRAERAAVADSPSALSPVSEVGIFAESPAGVWNGAAVHGVIPGASLPQASALLGQAATGFAVRGESTHGTGVSGSTEFGSAVYGFDSGTAQGRGYGGYFMSQDGVGLFAMSSASSSVSNVDAPAIRAVSGFGSGVTALSHGDSQVAVRGEATGSNAYGGFFWSHIGVPLRVQRDWPSGFTNLIEAWTVGTSDLQFKVEADGDVFADGAFSGGGADLAEMLPPGEAALEPGDVLCIDSDGRVVRCRRAFQSEVLGVYSTQPAFLGGDERDASGERLHPGHVPVAIVGIVPVKAVGDNGRITAGDLLAASDEPGHAMKAGATPPQGTVIGKALAPLEGRRGVVRMLVTLQ